MPPNPLHQSAFRPVIRPASNVEATVLDQPDVTPDKEEDSDDEVDIETTEDDDLTIRSHVNNPVTVNQSARDSSSPQCWSPPRESVSNYHQSYHCFKLFHWNRWDKFSNTIWRIQWDTF